MQNINLSTEEVKVFLEELAFSQRNITDITAICILALANTKKRDRLIKGKESLSDGARITDILKFANDDLGKNYAENTRETIRKHSLKYLVEDGFVLVNADDPSRPTNSGLTNYVLSEKFKDLLFAYQNKSSDFNSLKDRFINIDVLARRAEIEVLKKHNVNITVPGTDETLSLSPGDHNIIEKFIVEELFTLGYISPKLVYLGDTKEKNKFIDENLSKKIKLTVNNHAKIPDVVGFDTHSNTVIIYEAVASSGPIDELRKKELVELFSKCSFKINFYTVFLTTRLYQRFSSMIAAGTTVYIIESKQKISYSMY